MLKNYILSLLIFLTSTAYALHSDANLWCDQMIAGMSREEKIGQLFMIAVYSNKDKDYEDQIERLIREYHVGGLIFFQGDPVHQAELTNRYQKASKYPLMIGLDAEHGLGWRLKTAMEFPRMLINGAISNDSLLFRLGQAIARHCKELGVHVNFAPVVDVNNNPQNPIIGMRSFGEDPENVYKKAAMYIEGSLSENVLPVAKHFPGHGDTDNDSHLTLPVIAHNKTRLDSVELYPFRKLIGQQLPALMVGHLNVKALDSSNVPATLSPTIVQDYLRKELQFYGLCFTDAMNMKGVTQGKEEGEAEVKALKAGNDILLFPGNLEKAVRRIKQSIQNGQISEQEIENKCRKIMLAKYKYVLPNIQPLKTTGLWSLLNTPQDFALKQELYKNAITVIKNQANLLPLKGLDTLRIASVNLGSGKLNTFQTALNRYCPVKNFTLDNNFSEEQLKKIKKELHPYNCVILYNSCASERISRNFGYTPSLEKLVTALPDKRIILCHPSIPYGLSAYMHLPIDAVLISYEDHLYAREYAAQAIFGGIPVSGKLPVSVSSAYPVGSGFSLPQSRLGYALPEMCQLSSATLSRIDSICSAAIRLHATPGCQVLVAKDNYIVYNKAFGYNTYQKLKANHTSNIYDVASVTKIAATLPVILKLYDKKMIELDTALSYYYPPLQSTNKNEITIREVLAHQAGLKPFTPSFAEAIDQKALPGRLFTTVPTRHNTMKLKDRLYVNPNYHFKDSTLSRTPRPGYKAFTPGLYIFTSYRDSVLNSILTSPLTPKKEYVYSDLGFILLQKTAEQLTGISLDTLCKKYFFNKLGAYNTDYLAIQRLKNDYIIPSCIDKLYRKKEIKGYVHDPTASILGGISGHAGLFSTAEDLAKIMAMYLNEGYYGGEQLLSPESIRLFCHQTNLFPNNRRGLGVDKPELDLKKPGPTCPEAPASSFGHTGFTGTMVWADPDNRLIYIFLSNRTYPNEFNTKLSDENIRTKIQSVIYKALQQ